MAGIDDPVEGLKVMVEEFYQKIEQNDKKWRKGENVRKLRPSPRGAMSREKEFQEEGIGKNMRSLENTTQEASRKERYQLAGWKGPVQWVKVDPPIQAKCCEISEQPRQKKILQASREWEKKNKKRHHVKNRGWEWLQASQQIIECSGGRCSWTRNSIPTETTNQGQRQNKDYFQKFRAAITHHELNIPPGTRVELKDGPEGKEWETQWSQ